MEAILKTMTMNFLPDGLLCPVQSAGEGLATEDALAVLLNVVPKLPGKPWAALRDE